MLRVYYVGKTPWEYTGVNKNEMEWSKHRKNKPENVNGGFIAMYAHTQISWFLHRVAIGWESSQPSRITRWSQSILISNNGLSIGLDQGSNRIALCGHPSL
jgi:hypothetical protein